MTYFADMKDIKAKKPLLEKALKDLIKLQEQENVSNGADPLTRDR